MSADRETERFDLIVLGGGNAYRVARKCGEEGMRVALVEKGPLGGTCPHRGCIPSKLLLAYSQAAQGVRSADRFHVDATLRGIDASAALKATRDYVAPTDERFEEGLPEGVTLIRGTGRFVAPRTLSVDGRRLAGERVVLATGSRPTRASGPLNELPYWTSDDVFRLDELARSLTVVGGGLVGCELATFFAEMGVETTLVNRGERVLGQEDGEIVARAQKNLRERLALHNSTEIARARHDPAGFHLALRTTDETGEETEHHSEAVLVAIGRTPNTDDIGLEAAGIDVDSKGLVRVDDHRRASAEGVWAIGDVHGLHPFTHAAAHEAHYLAEGLAGSFDGPADMSPMAHAVFLHPPLAAVGPTEEALREQGTRYLAATREVSDTVAGRAAQDEHGLVKLLVSPQGEILAGHMLGPHAPEWVHEVSAAMKWRPHVSSLTQLIHVHPASSEVIRDVARTAASLVAD